MFAVCMILGLLASMAFTAAAARTSARWRPMFWPCVGLGCIVFAFGVVVILARITCKGSCNAACLSAHAPGSSG